MITVANLLCFTCDRWYDSIVHILSSRDVRPIFSSYFVAILRIQTVWTERNPNIWLHYGVGCARSFVSHASSLLVTRAIHFWLTRKRVKFVNDIVAYNESNHINILPGAASRISRERVNITGYLNIWMIALNRSTPLVDAQMLR